MKTHQSTSQIERIINSLAFFLLLLLLAVVDLIKKGNLFFGAFIPKMTFNQSIEYFPWRVDMLIITMVWRICQQVNLQSKIVWKMKMNSSFVCLCKCWTLFCYIYSLELQTEIAFEWMIANRELLAVPNNNDYIQYVNEWIGLSAWGIHYSAFC